MFYYIIYWRDVINMDNNNIFKIVDFFLDFLFVFENNIFKESDLLKKF